MANEVWMEMAGMTGHGWKWLEMAGNGRKWLERTINGLNGCKSL